MQDTETSFGLSQTENQKDASPKSPYKGTLLSYKSYTDQGLDGQGNDTALKITSLFDNDKIVDEGSSEGNNEDQDPSVSISDDEDDIKQNLSPKQNPTQERKLREEKEGERSPEQKPTERWKVLYAQKEKYDLKKEQLKKEYQTPEVDQECTFKPKLVSASIPGATSNLPIHERNKLWKEKQQAKLREGAEKEKERDLNNCTFKPQLKTAPKKIKETPEKPISQVSRGINEFLKRQATARQNKEKKEAILSNPLSRLPEYATKKGGKVTIGRYPNFCVPSDTSIEILALKKPLEPFPTTSPSKVNHSQHEQESSFAMTDRIGLPENPVYVSEITYADAIKKLREELYKIPINIE